MSRAPSASPSIATPSPDEAQLLIDRVVDYAIFVLDAEGHVRSWNAGARAIKGWEADEIVGRHFSAFYADDDRLRGRPALQLALATEHGRVEDRGWRVRKDGTRFWASVVITALRDPDDRLTGFAKVTRDLTSERETFEALRASEERFRLLVDGVTDYALYMLDVTGHVTTWNAGAARVKGYAADEIVGKHFSIFFPPDDVRAGKPTRELELATVQGRFEEESYRVRKDGRLFWANVIITPLRDPHGNVVGFAKITRDLTERREAERIQRELERAQVARSAAEDANRMKDEFLATVSHELRTPLGAILGWSSMLLGPGMEASLQKGLQTIHRNASAQARLIDDILDVSRIITGKLKIEVSPVDVVELVQDAVDVVKPAAAAKGIRLRWDPPRGPVRAVADPDRIRQVAWNLLSNAVKFTEGGGTVTVVVVDTSTEVVLRVTDDGKGIDASFLPYVFERFRQADSSTTRAKGGLGLGLAIVRHISELHGGHVSADSRGLGTGSTFQVVLPRVAPAPGRSSAERPDPQLPSLHGVRVVVVEDDPDARDLLRMILTRVGATATLTSNAVEALDALRSARPHVVLSDISMPGEDGYSLMRRMRALPEDAGGATPSIAVTAHTMAGDHERAKLAGFSAHVGKPVDPDLLVREIARLAGGSEAHRLPNDVT